MCYTVKTASHACGSRGIDEENAWLHQQASRVAVDGCLGVVLVVPVKDVGHPVIVRRVQHLHKSMPYQSLNPAHHCICGTLLMGKAQYTST